METLVLVLIAAFVLAFAWWALDWWRSRPQAVSVEYEGRTYWCRRDGTFTDSVGNPVRDDDLATALRAALWALQPRSLSSNSGPEIYTLGGQAGAEAPAHSRRDR